MQNPHLGTWTEANISGHTVEIFEPHCRHEQGWGILYLHDQRGRMPYDFPALMQAVNSRGYRIFAPRCGPTWWLDRIVPTFDEHISPRAYIVQQLLPFLEGQHDIATPRLALLGLRMGGQGALGLAYRYPDRFPVVAAITPSIDFQLVVADGDDILMALYDNPEAARQETVILQIHPLNWPRHQYFCCDPNEPHWFPSAERLRMKLSSLGVPHVCDLETAVANGAQYPCQMATSVIEFIGERLDQERRRL